MILFRDECGLAVPHQCLLVWIMGSKLNRLCSYAAAQHRAKRDFPIIRIYIASPDPAPSKRNLWVRTRRLKDESGQPDQSELMLHHSALTIWSPHQRDRSQPASPFLRKRGFWAKDLRAQTALLVSMRLCRSDNERSEARQTWAFRPTLGNLWFLTNVWWCTQSQSNPSAHVNSLSSGKTTGHFCLKNAYKIKAARAFRVAAR